MDRRLHCQGIGPDTLIFGKKRTAVEIYFVHSAPIDAPQSIFISTAVRFFVFFRTQYYVFYTKNAT
jgi:hypothetical protein